MTIARYVSNNKNGTQLYSYIHIAMNGEELAQHSGTGVIFPVNDVMMESYVNTNTNPFVMQLSDLNNKNAKLFSPIDENTPVTFNFIEDSVTTTLPKEMNANLVRFFKNYKPESKKDYCCLHFAYEMAYGRGSIKDDHILTVNIARTQTYENTYYEENLSPGNIIYMYKETDDHKRIHDHLAVYIGQKYYLSLFGTSGSLMIASLDAMKIGFQADKCVMFEEKMESKNMKFLEQSRELFLFKPKIDEGVNKVADASYLAPLNPLTASCTIV